MKFNYKKIGVIILLVFVILFIGEVRPAHAANWFTNLLGIGIEDITASAISLVAQAAGVIMGFIGGIFLSIGGYLITIALNINLELLRSPVVMTGWQIVLGFANLGFVLAIIVMAFATIFRVQSYAMKQTLWKLIVAALLVNFSLVIAGAFINISDIFSNYFLKQSGIRNPVEWVRAFTSMFRAQGLLQMENFNNQGGVLNNAAAAVNTFGGVVLTNIGSIFFIALFTILAAITLFAVAIMLLIRYVYLGILLLLSPIIWLLWIFPSTKHLWSRWWQQFLRWTFFTPIMLFFIYLAMFAMKNQPEVFKQFTQNKEATANVNLNFGVGVIGDMTIVIALVMGGLIAANSLGIEFSKTAYGWAQWGGKSFGKWVGKEALEQTGGRIFASDRMKRWTEKLSKGPTPIRFIGRGLNRLGATTEKTLQAEYAKTAKGLSPDRKNYEILNSRGVRRAVYMQQTAKDRDLDIKKLSPLIDNPEEYEAIAKNCGVAGIDFNDIVKATGRTVDRVKAGADMERVKTPEMKKAEIEARQAHERGDKDAWAFDAAFDELTTKNEAYKKAEARAQEEDDKFVQSQAPKDWNKGQWNDFFKPAANEMAKAMQKTMSAAFAKFEQGAYNKIAPQIKPAELTNFRKIMERGIVEATRQATELKAQAKTSDEREFADRLLAYIKGDLADQKEKPGAQTRLNRTLNRRAEFADEAWTGPQAAPTT